MDNASSEHPGQWVQLKGKCSDNAEVTASSTHSPEEVRVLVRVRCEQVTISRHYLDRKQVIDGQTVSGREPADAATEREASETNGGEDAHWQRQSILLC